MGKLARFLFATTFALSSLGLVSAASAIDLTGTWALKAVKCRQITPDGVVTETSFKAPDDSRAWNVTQDANGLMRMQFAASEPGVFFVPYVGAAYAKGNDLTTGAEGLLVLCPVAGEEYVEARRIVAAKTFPSNKKGISGKMLLQGIAAGDGASLGIPGGFSFGDCTIHYERIATDDPNTPGCPTGGGSPSGAFVDGAYSGGF